MLKLSHDLRQQQHLSSTFLHWYYQDLSCHKHLSCPAQTSPFHSIEQRCFHALAKFPHFPAYMG